MFVLEKYICLFLLAAIPLLYFPATHNPVLIKSLMIALTISVWVFFEMTRQKPSLKMYLNSAVMVLLLWLAVNFISLGLSDAAYINYLYLGEMLSMAGAFCLFQSGAASLSSSILLRVVNAAGFLVMAWGLMQFFKGYYKPVSSFGNPNYFGAFLITIWPLMILQWRQGKGWGRLLAFVNIVLFVFMIYYIHSLGMILSVVLSVFLLIWLYCPDIRKRLIFSLFAALACVVILAIPAVNNQFLHHVSSDIRPSIWKGVWRLILAHPWLGCGPGNFQIFYPEFRLPEYFTHPLSVDNTDHAHCEALEIIAETGFIGFAVFIFFLCAVFFRALKNFKRLDSFQRQLSASLLMGAALLIFENFFDVNLRHASSKFMLWSFLGLVSGLGGTEKMADTGISDQSRVRLITVSAVLAVILYFGNVRIFWADILFKQGIRARNENNYEKAVQQYRRALKIDPYHIEARYRLAFLYGSSGYLDKGVTEYMNVIKLAPYFASVHGNLAVLHSKADNLKLSENHYRIQIRLNPYNPETFCGLASILLRENRIEEAVVLLRHALILKPSHPFAGQMLKELREVSRNR